ncbi:MAG: VWA domain-containing protein [Thermoanaerobaculia bacterium]
MKLRIAIASLFLAAPLLAQVRETVNVNVVEIPVTVVDSSGEPVRGLTAANFELLDGGKKRDITSFDMIDFASAVSRNAISPLNPAARRSFLLLFDLGFSSPNALQRAQEAARRFVRESVEPRDLISVGSIDVNKGFRLLSGFTTDRDLVASAISDPMKFRGTDPLGIANQVGGNEAVTLPTAQPTGGAAGRESFAADAEANAREVQAGSARNNQHYMRQKIESQVDALGQLAKTLRAVPGRKQIIFLSEGFDASVLQGRDARASSDQAAENEAVTHGQVWTVDSDARYGNSSSLTVLDRMAQYFRQSDVVLHALDIQGVRVQNDASGSRINSNAGLFMLARPTGGEVFQNENNLKSNFGRMLHSQEVVYVLGFQAPLSKAGTFHELKLKLVNVPARSRVSYRTGYYEPGADTPAERSLTDAEIVVNDIPQSDIHVAALSAAFPNANGNAQVPLILELNGKDLVQSAKGSSAAAEIYVYAFDSEGVVRDRLYQRIQLDLKKVGDRLRSTGVRYYGTLSLPPGQYAIKSLVRTTDGDKRGFARSEVTVSKPNEMAPASPIPIDEDPKWLLVRGKNTRASGAYPFTVSGQDYIPSATLVSGQPRKIAVYVFGLRPNEFTFQTSPKTKLLGTLESPGFTTLVLQLDDAAGASSLDVTIQKKGATTSQKSSVALARP